MLQDLFKRPLRDLRISVTDRCNFRCSYCMPAEVRYQFLPRKALLSFEEITQLVKLFVPLGVRKIRLTGGEPLLRKDLPELISMLHKVPDVEDIAMTTNGFFLTRFAQQLADAGLHRVTVSLDSLDPEIFAESSGSKTTPAQVLEAMDHAANLGLKIKVNAVIKRGLNDHEIVDMARCFKERGYPLRFIEFMDVGNVNGWDLTHVVPASEILDKISQEFPCEPVEAAYPGEVARRYRYTDNGVEFGMITSVSNPFCGGCNRARLSAEGQLYTCLFTNKGHDLKNLLREHGEEAVVARIQEIWGARKDRYSEQRGDEQVARDKVEMFKIGG